MQLLEPTKQLRKPKRHLAISKLKIKHGDKFKLQLDLDLPPDDNETKLLKSTYTEKPNPGFFKALGLILETVVTRCGLNRDLWADGKITDITIKETEDGTNAIIVACLDLSDETQVTAKLAEKNISYELKEELANLSAEVEDYINGDRPNNHKQISLFEQ